MDESLARTGESTGDTSGSDLHGERGGTSEPKRRLVELLEIEAELAGRMIEILQALKAQDEYGARVLSGEAHLSQFLVPEGLALREKARAILPQLVSVVSQVRSAAVRELIDLEGYSVQRVARLMEHPRQMVKRLYDAGRQQSDQ
jgi:hypothetical protein